MTPPRLRTAIIGFGKIGAGYADDPVMARYYPFATHAQALASHPACAWEAVVDVSPQALELARTRWQIPHAFTSAADLARAYSPEVAVIATPPESRLDILHHFSSLRAVLVEKPLGLTPADGQAFLDECQRRHILVQVALWRRADRVFRELAAGRLMELIGKPQAVFGIYGNGLLNNGTHMVDFVRMLLGEIEAVQAVGGFVPYVNGPIPDDFQFPFSLRLSSELVAMFQPVRFEHYRENSLEIWGEKAKLLIAQEGLYLSLSPCQANRAMQGEKEIAADQHQRLDTSVGYAFYQLYDNLVSAINDGTPLWSSGSSALQTSRVVEMIQTSAQHQGALIELA